MKIGVITYDTHHLKTEQLVLSFAANSLVSEVKLLTLPFQQRAERDIGFLHRPDQTVAMHSRDLANVDKVSMTQWDGYALPDSDIDCFIIAGAGILNVAFAQGKPIVNAHPGIIPTTRGLDSFKWAILENDPVGVTLHLIDDEVDKGEVLVVRETPVFASDSIASFARRHYESEIDLMRQIPSLLDRREHVVAKEKPARMRMPKDAEEEMLENFEHWKSLYVQ